MHLRFIFLKAYVKLNSPTELSVTNVSNLCRIWSGKLHMQIIPQQDILQINLNLRMSQNTNIISVRYVNWLERSPFNSEKIFSSRSDKTNTQPYTAENSIC